MLFYLLQREENFMTKTKKKKRLWLKILIGIIIAVIIVYLGICFYFINYGFGRKTKKTDQPTREAIEWLNKTPQQTWHEKAVGNDKIELVARYVPAAEKNNKTIVVAHGWHEDSALMARYIKMFHGLGYNVLAPDDRGSGRSGGKYLSFGWLDRLDYVKWINQLIQREGKNTEIGLFGVSMGGATVMNISGEKLPPQVKCVVEDCGFSSIYQEFHDVISNDFHIPAGPILAGGAYIAKPIIGFNFDQANTLKQLAKDKLPILFIHGDKDKFVRTYMVYQNYKATKAPKEIWITKNTSHAHSLKNHYAEYRERVGAFFAKYLN